MNEATKAAKYENLHPQTGISQAHAAERWERRVVKDKYGRSGRIARRGANVVGSITVPNAACWCQSCGKFKHDGQCG